MSHPNFQTHTYTHTASENYGAMFWEKTASHSYQNTKQSSNFQSLRTTFLNMILIIYCTYIISA